MRTPIVTLLGGVLALGLAGPVLAQTTGRITGTVVDAQGGAIPGATVTATSPQLQGARTATTDSTGQYQLPTLPPGKYTVKADLSGFQTATRQNVSLELDQTATVNLTLQVAGVEQALTVTAAPPTVDVTSTTGGITAGQNIFSQLPVQRNFYAVSRLAPGVNEDLQLVSDDGLPAVVGPAAHGSTGAENQYIIEGLNMTGIIAGQERKTINFDFIQDVNVKTEGMNAEYGRTTGAVIEAITKSGGNTYHGGLFAYGTGGPLTAQNSTADKVPQTTTQVSDVAHQWDAGFDLGGYILKDKLWFFGAYDRINERDDRTVIRPIPKAAAGTPSPGDVVPQDVTRETFAGKLTFNIGHNQTLVGSVNGDPSTRDGAIFPIQGPSSTWNGTLDQGGVDGIVRYDGVFRNTWLLEAIYGRHNENNTYSGLGTTQPALIDATVSPNSLSGGFGFYQDSDLARDDVRAELTKYLGRHTLKGGVDFEHVDALVRSHQGGAGQRVYQFTADGVDFYRHRYYVNDLAPGFNRDDSASWVIIDPLQSEPVDYNTALFAQDSFRAMSNLTIDAGVRWERQDVYGRNDTKAFSLTNNWAARVGAVFDPTNDGRTKIYAHYGRFFENIPMDINIRSFGGELTCFCYNYSSDPTAIVPVDGTPRRTSLLGGPEPVDSPLNGQYVDEYLVGVEREIAPSLVVAARYNYRTLGRVIEDFLTESGEYFVANPGKGTLGKTLTFYDYTQAQSPDARRVNHSLEFSARKRFSNNWQMIASYVWSKLEGNYDGTFQNATSQLDPNINSAFDFADFLINADGPLTADRRHQIKFDASYQWSDGPVSGLNLGVSTRYLSGLPLTAYGYSFVYQNWEYYLTPRGGLGRGPADYEADLHVGYPIRLGNNRSVSLSLDIFNLFDRQAATLLDQRYNLDSDPACAGIPDAICNGDNGLQHLPVDPATGLVPRLTPVAQLADPRSTATNPDFLKAGRAFTAPFSARIGARLTF